SISLRQVALNDSMELQAPSTSPALKARRTGAVPLYPETNWRGQPQDYFKKLRNVVCAATRSDPANFNYRAGRFPLFAVGPAVSLRHPNYKILLTGHAEVSKFQSTEPDAWQSEHLL